MALLTTRIQLGKIFSPGKLGCQLLLKSLNFKKTEVILSANIYTKIIKDKMGPRPKPWDYENKGYNFIHALYDTTTKRMDENSKVIVVDGNIGSGKSEFAQALAKELDMKFYPETTMDDTYINEYGLNFRDLDSQLPLSCRSFDVTNFYQNPFDKRVARFQINMLQLRFERYIQALAYLFNTGGGVVLDRSVYSDFVFMETSFKFGYISKQARNIYNEIKVMILNEILKPHLIIYLDVPTDIIMSRIKKRNRKEEINSKVLTTEYIQTISDIYKEKFLKEMDKSSEVVIYDWSEYGDAEAVAEDIERIDFDKYDLYDKKLQDWRLKTELDWNELRHIYTDDDRILQQFRVIRYDCPELLISGEDNAIKEAVMRNAPGWYYRYGYDPVLDKNLLFKNSHSRKTLKPRPI